MAGILADGGIGQICADLMEGSAGAWAFVMDVTRVGFADGE